MNLDGFVEIPGFRYYSINKKGEVYSSWLNRLLVPTDNGHGYLRVVLTNNNGARISRYIHRLLAQTFIPNPNNDLVVRHLNDVKRDNRLENLAWGSYKDNADDCIKNGKNNPTRSLSFEQVKEIYYEKDISRNVAKKHGMSRSVVKAIKGGFLYKEYTSKLGDPWIKRPKVILTDDQVVNIFKDERTQRDIGEEYGISHSQVGNIKRRETYKHLTKDLGEPGLSPKYRNKK